MPGSEVRFARVIVPKSGISVNLGGTAEKFRPKAVFNPKFQGGFFVMVIDDKLIQYLEDLSRLRLTEEEKEKSKEELGKILNYVDMLNELDTTGVEEMSHPFSFTNNFREDEAVNTENREALLANAPEQKDGCFKVPQTVE